MQTLEQIREYMRHYRDTHREAIRANSRRFRKNHLEAERERIRRWNLTDAAKRSSKTYRDKIKAEVIAAYGDTCAECGCGETDLLEVDHMRGGGNKHREDIRRSAGQGFYRWLRTNKFPKDFQLLCVICHILKHRGQSFNPMQLVSSC